MSFFFFSLYDPELYKKVIIKKMLCKVVLFYYNSMVNSWLHKKMENGSIKM